MITITEYLKAAATYTRHEAPSKTPYTQFILGLRDGVEVTVDRETYIKVKKYLEEE